MLAPLAPHPHTPFLSLFFFLWFPLQSTPTQCTRNSYPFIPFIFWDSWKPLFLYKCCSWSLPLNKWTLYAWRKSLKIFCLAALKKTAIYGLTLTNYNNNCIIDNHWSILICTHTEATFWHVLFYEAAISKVVVTIGSIVVILAYPIPESIWIANCIGLNALILTCWIITTITSIKEVINIV